MQFLSLSHIDEVISSFPMESPEPFSYFHPFHCNIYIYYELNEFLWFFILFPVFFWCDYNTTAPYICQYIFVFYFIIFFLLLFNLNKFHNIYILIIFFWLFIHNKHFQNPFLFSSASSQQENKMVSTAFAGIVVTLSAHRSALSKKQGTVWASASLPCFFDGFSRSMDT